MNDKWEWLAALSGIAFLVVAIVGFAIAGEPPNPTDDSTQEIIDFYVDNKDEQYVGGVLAAFGGMFLIIFGGYLRKVLSRAEGENGFLSAVSMAGLIVLAIGIAIDATIAIALAESADDVEPAAVEALSALWNNDFIPFALGVVTFLLSTGISIVRHGALPKWMGWVAIVAAVTAVSPAFFVALIVAALLIAISSVMLSLRARAANAPAA